MTNELAQSEAMRIFNTFRNFQVHGGRIYGSRYTALESSLFLVQTLLDKGAITKADYKKLNLELNKL